MKTMYVAKPIAVEAIMYDGSNAEEICDFCEDAFVEDGKLMMSTVGDRAIAIQRNAYVICNAGKFTVARKTEFENEYQEIDDRHCICASSMY